MGLPSLRPAGLHPSLSLLPGIPRNRAAPVPSVSPASGRGYGMGLGSQDLGCQDLPLDGSKEIPMAPGEPLPHAVP